MNRSALVLGMVAATCALGIAERSAKACGGCFHPPTQTVSDITDERMLLSVSQTQTTLYDQLRYTGNPKNFAWVLPIHGIVEVGLSADVLFDSVDLLTTTQIQPPVPNCPPPPPNCAFPAAGGFAADAGVANDGVTVTKAENVGPYATVQLHSTSSAKLEKWLADNGYSIPVDVKPVIDQYVTEGFDFLAMKLLPNQGVQAMRPVRITAPGASLSLPLRMAAVGTGASVGITIWVVGDGRYEPQNFPFFHIEDTALVWDWKTSSSNYTTLRAAQEKALGGKGWEIESSMDLSEVTVTNVIMSGGRYYNGGFTAPGDAGLAAASEDYLPITAGDAGASDAAPGTQTAEQVRAADVKALFAGMTGPNVRITRIRSDITHAAMTKDFVLQASADQAELSNIRLVTHDTNLVCPSYTNCGGPVEQPDATPVTDPSGTPVGDPGPSEVYGGSGGSSSGSGSGGGCVVSSQSDSSGFGFGAAMAALGLVIARTVRRQRGSKDSRRAS